MVVLQNFDDSDGFALIGYLGQDTRGIDPSNRLQNLVLLVDLRHLLNDQNEKFRPMHRWARNKLTGNPDGVVELPPSSIRELATFVGCIYHELAKYLARFLPEETGATTAIPHAPGQ